MTPTPITCLFCTRSFIPVSADPRYATYCPRCSRRKRRTQRQERIGLAIRNAWFDLRHPGWWAVA